MFRIMVLLCVAFCVPTIATAECFDSPSWDGNRINQAYIDSLPNAPEYTLRRAHLRMLLLSEKSVPDRLERVKQYLLPRVLLQYEGDRGELRKQLKAMPTRHLIEAIDFEKLKQNNSTGDARLARGLAQLFWLHGCTSEAIAMLDKKPRSARWVNYWVAGAPLSEKPEHDMNWFIDRRRDAIEKLMENPADAETVLAEMLTHLASNTVSDVGSPYTEGIKLTLKLVRSEEPTFKPPQLPENPSDLDYTQYYAAFANIVIWPALAGYCTEVKKLAEDLFGLPINDLDDPHRSALEASYIRCEAT